MPTAAELVLQELVSARQQLVEQRTVLLQQQTEHLSSIVQRLDRARLKLLQRQIAQLELAIGSILEEQSALKQKVERLQQVKGVGLITAVTCVALCPELGSLSTGRTEALVGVAPYDDDSGARKGWRHIAGGRPKLRRALYHGRHQRHPLEPSLAPLLPATASAQQTTQSRFGGRHQKTSHPLEPPAPETLLFCQPAKHSCYNGTFVQRIVVTAMQAVKGVPTGFTISILKRATNLRHRAGVCAKSQPNHRHKWGSEGRKTAAPRCPKLPRDSAAHTSCRVSKTQAQGLIHHSG